MNRIAWFNVIAFAGTMLTYAAEKLFGLFAG